MMLIDLEPSFYNIGGEGIYNPDGSKTEERVGMGLIFLCPCGCRGLCSLGFENPIDKKEPYSNDRTGVSRWRREGETFESMSLQPSILIHPSPSSEPPCRGWHGYLINGEMRV